jgi:hypothetical protein
VEVEEDGRLKSLVINGRERLLHMDPSNAHWLKQQDIWGIARPFLLRLQVKSPFRTAVTKNL